MRILIVPDKFKGTLDAARVAKAIAAGWHAARPKDVIHTLPMSDGGDGFGTVLGDLLGAELRRTRTVDAAGRPRTACWWWSSRRRTAIIETAQSNGLALLPAGHYHPFDLDTRGVAPILRAAYAAGARSCLLGVGGSATNDGGFGLALALGWRFLDKQGRALTRWIDLDQLSELAPPAKPQPPCAHVVATDVSNPLLGSQGASRIYGPQKGLKPVDFSKSEACLRRLAKVVRHSLGFDSRSPGSGAAGGLGFGLQAFLGARRELGFDVFARMSKLDAQLKRCDLVITGEGSADRSTLMGKGVGQLLAACERHQRPVVLLAGRTDLGTKLPSGLIAAGSLLDHVGERAALEQTARSLRSLARHTASRFLSLPGNRG